MVRLKHRYFLINILYPDTLREIDTAVQETRAGSIAEKEHGRDIPPSVLLHRPSPDSLTPQVLVKAIREQIAELFGDYGAAAVGGSLVVKYFSPATSTAIIRVARAHFRILWAALTFITSLPVSGAGDTSARQGRGLGKGTDCVIQVIRVSGTMRKSEEEAIRRAKADILRARRSGIPLDTLTDHDHDNTVSKGIIDEDDVDDEDSD